MSLTTMSLMCATNDSAEASKCDYIAPRKLRGLSEAHMRLMVVGRRAFMSHREAHIRLMVVGRHAFMS